MPLFDVALGLRLTNVRYASLAATEPHTATRDLKMLVDAGLIVPEGEKRGRYYRRAQEITELRTRSRLPRSIADPYQLLKKDEGSRLPGL